MTEILQAALPDDLETDRRLPGVRPIPDGRWLRCDDAYAAQMAYRRKLLTDKMASVFWQDPASDAAVNELFEAALSQLPALGFGVNGGHIRCPDGHDVNKTADTPLAVLGQSVQEDLCILQKQGDEHVLTAAVLCFPASWTLAEKAGKPLTAIHKPVDAYNAQLARRVQRLFDGVQAGKPLWRNNLLRYDKPDLYQPRSETVAQRPEPLNPSAAYLRAERQCILRLLGTRAVVFSIHTYVVKNT